MKKGYSIGKKLASLAMAGVMALGTVVSAPQLRLDAKASGLAHGLSAPSVNADNWVEYDIVEFGKYWQEDTNGDGVADRNDEKTPIQWRVLQVDDKEDCVLLLSDKILDYQWYNAEDVNKNINAPEEVILVYSPFHQWFSTNFLKPNKIDEKNSDNIWGEFNDAFEAKWGKLEKTINPYEFKTWYNNLTVSQMNFFGSEFKKKWGSINGTAETALYPADITWERSTIRSWLNAYGRDPSNEDNGYFNNEGIDFTNADNFYMNAFEGVSRQLISKSYTTGANPNYSWVDVGGETKDKVFLLSVDDIANSGYGFRDYIPGTGYDPNAMTGNFGIKYGVTFYDVAKTAVNTAYAGGQVYGSQYNAPTSNKRSNSSLCGTGSYMLRTPGQAAWKVCVVDEGGNVDTDGISVCTLMETRYGVRPAIWLNLRDFSQPGYPMSDTWKKVERRAIKYPSAIEHVHVARTEATCTSKAICKICMEYFGEKDPTNHTCGPATCTEAVTCLRCGYSEDINPDNHSFLPANCTRGKRCELCGYETGDPNPNVHETTPPTCRSGETCTLCGKTLGDEIDRYNHVNTEIRNYVAPGEMTLGYTGDKHCTECGMMIQKGKELPAVGKYGISNPTKDMYGNRVYDRIYFGNYWQVDTNQDGLADKKDDKTPIRWRVLSVEGDKALIMADQILDYMYDEDSSYIWDTSSVRSWLNGYDSTGVDGKDYVNDYPSFIGTAFTGNERNAILDTNLDNTLPSTIAKTKKDWCRFNTYYDTFNLSTSVNTTDKIFLLSTAETRNTKYGFISNFGIDEEWGYVGDTRDCHEYTRMLCGSDFSYNQRGITIADIPYEIFNYGKYEYWDTRDTYYYQCGTHKTVTPSKGMCVSHRGMNVSDYSSGNIVPALYIDLSKTDVWTKAEAEVCSIALDEEHVHTGGEASCAQLAICDTCHQAYGEFNANAHTAGKATCCSKVVCKACGEEYGDYDPDNHVETTIRGKKTPELGKPGYDGDLCCVGCDKVLEKGNVLYVLECELNGGYYGRYQYNPSYYTVGKQFELTSPIKDDCEFVGWYLDNQFTTPFPSDTTQLTGDIKVYAKWDEAEAYPITYELDGGVNDPDNPATYTLESGIISLNAPTKKGYKFLGWYLDAEFSESYNIYYKPEGGFTVYARWSKNRYNVDTETNGGTFSEGTQNPTYYYSADGLKLVNSIRKSGYSFDGWYLDAEFTRKAPTYEESMYMEGDIKVYAKWTANEYQIRYELNGGTNNPDNPTKYQITDGTIALLPATRSGYTFEGWYLDEYFVNRYSEEGELPLGGFKVYAKWAANTNTITTKLNGGSYVGDAQNPTAYVTSVGFTLVDKNNIKKEDYIFEGWYLDEDFATPVPEDTTTLYDDITVYAKWREVQNYSISYVLNGGTNAKDNPTSYKETDTEISLKEATRTGYTFDGWCTDQNLTSKFNPSGALPMGGITLYAKWKVVTYDIAYELDGGAFGADVTPIRTFTIASGFDGVNVSDRLPSKTGYAFTGWMMKQGSETAKKLPEQTTGIYGDVTLVATWEKNVFDITTELNGGAYVSDASNPTSYKKGEGFTLVDKKSLRKTDSIFEGWYLDAELTIPVPSNTTLLTGEITVYAKWRVADSYSITYVLNGGTNAKDNPETYKVTDDSIDLKPATKSGYTFEGWYTDSEFENLFDPTAELQENGFVVYAKWSIITYTITYELDEGMFAETAAPIYSYTIESGFDTLFDEENIPSKDNCVFAGWTMRQGSEEATEIPEETTGLYGDIVVIANWKRIFNLASEFNGGACSSDFDMPQTYIEGEGFVLPDKFALKKRGYVFEGWYLDEELTEVVPEDTTAITGDITVYANWTESDACDITYMLAGGTNHPDNPVQYKLTEEGLSLNDPSKNGYTFAGWYLDEDFYYAYDANEELPEDGIVLYAKWEIITYTIAFDLDGGAFEEGVTPIADYTIEDGFDEIFDKEYIPSKEGYDFDGWLIKHADEQVEEISKDSPDSTIGIYGDVIVIATWKEVIPDENTPGTGDPDDENTQGPGGSGDNNTPGTGGSGDDNTPGTGGPDDDNTPGTGGTGDDNTPGTGGSGNSGGSGNGNTPGSGSGTDDSNEDEEIYSQHEKIVEILRDLVGSSTTPISDTNRLLERLQSQLEETVGSATNLVTQALEP
ncbi:MAG: InlB B-repeat-containing protein [Lachnospiraceae bacterium]|nr:InlB B-repeat-containing protein [Lachnospiraceae bacterium]